MPQYSRISLVVLAVLLLAGCAKPQLRVRVQKVQIDTSANHDPACLVHIEGIVQDTANYRPDGYKATFNVGATWRQIPTVAGYSSFTVSMMDGFGKLNGDILLNQTPPSVSDIDFTVSELTWKALDQKAEKSKPSASRITIELPAK